jgi:hypothetical protein
MSSTHEHLEHAEHAQHAGYSPFDKRVAMSIAIIAALLACVTMLSHRSHNETLRFQADGNRMRVESSNAWSQYQAKRLRQAQYELLSTMLPVIAPAGDSESQRQKITSDWKGEVKRYKEELVELKEKAEGIEKGAEHALEESHESHHRGDRFDLAELFVELGLVLCSVAVLTKRPGFWLSGMASAAFGAVVALSVMFMH